MLAIATIERHLDALHRRLHRVGLSSFELVAPASARRVALVGLDDEARSEAVAVALRAEGWMAVTRPAGDPSLSAWRHATQPVVIADHITVCLAWSEHDRRNLPEAIEIGPGGFGSGHHPTTRMLAEAIVARVSPGHRVLDVGCGSGVLALCAVRAGAAAAVAVDRKPEAVAAARANAELNEMADVARATTTPIEALDERFELVVANIARAGVVALAPQLVASVAAGGLLMVSGISPAQRSLVAGHLRPLVVVDGRDEGEWSTLTLAAV